MAERKQAGWDEWMRRVLEEHEGPLVRYAYRLTGDIHRARDAVQETFLRLCGEDRQRIESHLAAWLFCVCRSRALDVQRKESRMQTLSGAEADLCTSRQPLPEEVVEQQETASRVTATLGTLPANQQEVVRLKFQNGLSYREISQVTGLSVSNVGFLLHTAVKSLRQRLNQPAPDRVV